MKIRTLLHTLLFALLTMAAMPAEAQFDNTLNAFSPYTFYGIGDLNFSGTAATKTMGGIGAATRSGTSFNIVNPASYSAAAPQAFLFSFGMQGRNDYLKSGTFKSSHNAFNINDVSLQFRILEGLGFGLSVAPYSTVGYKASFVDNSSSLADLGVIRYSYTGSGGITQFKAGLGWKPVKGLSIGVNMLYYLGSIKRISESTFSGVISSSDDFRITRITDKRQVNTMNVELGAQYDIRLRGGRAVTFGAVYEPQRRAGMRRSYNAVNEGAYSTDTIASSASKTELNLPHKVVAGFAYRTGKLVVGADYDFQKWSGGMNDEPVSSGGFFSTTDSRNIRAGFEYTPNRYDIRDMLKRWTYRGGIRYGNTYYRMNGRQIKEYAITVGFGAPLQRNSFTAVNFGAEVGQTGRASGSLTRDTFFKIYLGFNIFATQDWFIRHKFK